MYKTPHCRSHFGSSDVQKWRAAVAKSLFWSHNVKKLTVSEHFLKFRCSKMPRGCGEKHICKSKCTKHYNRGPILEVSIRQNCTPLWREAHLQVKMHKTLQSRTNFGSFDPAKLHAAVARSTFASKNAQKHHMFGPLFEDPMYKNRTLLWREAHLQLKMCKTPAFWSILRGF